MQGNRTNKANRATPVSSRELRPTAVSVWPCQYNKEAPQPRGELRSYTFLNLQSSLTPDGTPSRNSSYSLGRGLRKSLTMDKRFNIVQSFNRHLRQKSRLQTTDGYGNNKISSTDQQADGAEAGLSIGASKLDSINPNKRVAESVNDVYPGDGARRIKQRSGSVPLSPVSSPVFDSFGSTEIRMLLQPETRPITQDQLVNEVRGIYAGLVMLEKKCVEIDQQQSQTTNKLSKEQWQALIALYRTLLHEHHDFFLASQHPSSSPAVRRLATKYAMPARLWRHGIHSFLELLRHRLPESLDHMLAFVYLAYSMMALLMESVPSFEETWIECLGDLARYRMAIEEADLRDREIWSGVARVWYNKAADKSPNVGRIQHHLAVLARPNVSQQLFYFTKALVSVVPFQNARESIMLLFNPFLEANETASKRYSIVDSALVKASGILFVSGSIWQYVPLMEIFCKQLDSTITSCKEEFRVSGPEFACSLCASTVVFGEPQSFLTRAFRSLEEQRKSRTTSRVYQEAPASEEQLQQDPTILHAEANAEAKASMRAHWAEMSPQAGTFTASEHLPKEAVTEDARFSGPDEVTAYACHSLQEAITVVARRIGNKDIVPFMHSILVYIYGLAFVPGALEHVEAYIPWEHIATFLNTVSRSGMDPGSFESDSFPKHRSGTGWQLPEDFVFRGLMWAQWYYPPDFFTGEVVDEEERTLELPSHGAPRAERCLWLGHQLAQVSPAATGLYHSPPDTSQLHRWLNYNRQSRQFSATDFAQSLESLSTAYTFDSRSETMSVESDSDSTMLDWEQ